MLMIWGKCIFVETKFVILMEQQMLIEIKFTTDFCCGDCWPNFFGCTVLFSLSVYTVDVPVSDPTYFT